MLHMPSPMLFGETVPPYAAFLANIRARTSYVLAEANSTLDGVTGISVTTSGLFRVQSKNYSQYQTTVGSCWGGDVVHINGGQIGGAVRQGFPSQAVFDSQVSNSGEVLIRIESAGDQYGYGSTRNGFTSESSSSYGFPPSPSFHLVELTYFDFASQRGRTMNPYGASGPADY